MASIAPHPAQQQQPLVPVQPPQGGPPDGAWCRQLEAALLASTWHGAAGCAQVLPAATFQALLAGAQALLNKEPTLVEVQPSTSGQQRVTVVGDTHGQVHDLCRLFQRFGHPSEERLFVFNGDYVDRGAWGVETLCLLLAWKAALPRNVVLLRGNHETAIITRIYGFHAELKAKYGPAAKGLFVALRRLFAALPLACCIEGATLVLHGGLFRAPPAKPSKGGGKRRRPSGAKLVVGTLADIRAASKGGQDPDPDRSAKALVASDLMWSDPVNAPGLRENEARGCGTVFGPDVTQAFLAANGLRLIVRSHEGPDARDKRLEGDRMPCIDSGYAEDHVGPAGKLVTLFSAPDYPQFMAEGEERYRNRAAVLHLTAPDWATPAVESFEAVLPRPEATSYYELPGVLSEEEDEAKEQQQQQHLEAEALPAATGKPEAASAGEQPQQQQQQQQQQRHVALSAAAGLDDDSASAGTVEPPALGASEPAPARTGPEDAAAAAAKQQKQQQQQPAELLQESGSNSLTEEGGGAAAVAEPGVPPAKQPRVAL